MNERKCREVVYARSNSVCEMCGGARATEAHHRMNRSQGGKWTPENCLHLCSKDHRYVTEHPQVAREQGWAVPSHGDPATTPVWFAWRGWVFLDDTGHIEEAEETA